MSAWPQTHLSTEDGTKHDFGSSKGHIPEFWGFSQGIQGDHVLRVGSLGTV